MDLLSLEELRVWTRQDIPDDDPFAVAVIGAASLKVLNECGNPTSWTSIGTTPAVARMIAVQLAKRTYLNPDALIAEGGIGPIGGDRYVEEFARTLELTQAEKDDLGRLEGVTTRNEDDLAPWVAELVSGDDADDVLYVRDSDGSNWALPLLQVDRDPYYVPVD